MNTAVGSHRWEFVHIFLTEGNPLAWPGPGAFYDRYGQNYLVGEIDDLIPYQVARHWPVGG